MKDARGIRADADERDKQADGRDWDASKRDLAANTQFYLHDDDQDGKALAVRAAARQDRANSKSNRNSSAVDRALLAEDDDPRDGDTDKDVPDG